MEAKREDWTRDPFTLIEEGGGHVNGAAWLVANKRDLIDAAFALNEGAGVR